MKSKVIKRDGLYTVQVNQGAQSFKLDYHVEDKDSAKWYKSMFDKAVIFCIEEAKAKWKKETYTNEEVLQLMISAVDYIDAGIPTAESEIRDWFNLHKKK